MFVVTLSKTSLKKLGAGAACCALVVFSAMLGRFISTRTVAVAAPVNRIESAQDIQTWFTGYGLDVDGIAGAKTLEKLYTLSDMTPMPDVDVTAAPGDILDLPG